VLLPIALRLPPVVVEVVAAAASFWRLTRAIGAPPSRHC
jgi:hypothetical protein